MKFDTEQEIIERISHASILVAFPNKDRWSTMTERTKQEHRKRSKLRLEMMRKVGLNVEISKEK